MKVYVINLIESSTRKQNMLDQLRMLGIDDYEFIEAIRGTNIPEDTLPSLYNADKCIRRNRRELNKNEIGCSLSHQKAYRAMIDAGDVKAIILEDDVKLSPDFNEVIHRIDSLETKRTVIKFDIRDSIRTIRSHEIRISNEYSIQHPLTSVPFTWGYYIDIDAARRMLDSYFPVYTAADDWFHFRKGIRLRSLNKQVVFEIGLESDIGSRPGVEDRRYPRAIRKIIRTADDIVSYFH